MVLAVLSHRDLVPAISLPDPRVRRNASSLAFDFTWSSTRSMLKHRIHSTLINFGRPSPVSDLFGVKEQKLLGELDFPEPWRGQRRRVARADRRSHRPDRPRQPAPASRPRRPPLRPATHERPGDRLGVGLHDRRRDRRDRALRLAGQAHRLYGPLPPRGGQSSLGKGRGYRSDQEGGYYDQLVKVDFRKAARTGTSPGHSKRAYTKVRARVHRPRRPLRGMVQLERQPEHLRNRLWGQSRPATVARLAIGRCECCSEGPPIMWHCELRLHPRSDQRPAREVQGRSPAPPGSGFTASAQAIVKASPATRMSDYRCRFSGGRRPT